MSQSSSRLQDLRGGPSFHVGAVVASAGVVPAEPVLQEPVQVHQPIVAPAMEGRPVALLQHGAVEPFHQGVVVGRAGRDPVVVDLELGQGPGEGLFSYTTLTDLAVGRRQLTRPVAVSSSRIKAKARWNR